MARSSECACAEAGTSVQVMPASKKPKVIVGRPARSCPVELGRGRADPATHSRGQGLTVIGPGTAPRHSRPFPTQLLSGLQGSAVPSEGVSADYQPLPTVPQATARFVSGPAGSSFRLPRRSLSRPRRARSNRNTRRSQNWQSAHPHLLSHRIRAENTEPARRTALADSTSAEVLRRISTASVFCSCGGRGSASQQHTVYVDLVHIQGTVTVQLPRSVCTTCSAIIDPQPTDLFYFPATPSTPTIWYDEQLLILVSQIRLRCATAYASLTTALADLHGTNGLSSKPAVWTHLQEACMQWLKLEQRLHDPAAYGVAPPQGCEGHRNCPCCYKTLTAGVFDSCLGLTRLASAASSSSGVQPSLSDPRMLPDDEVKAFLQQQGRNVSFGGTECATFTAASVRGRR